MQNRITFEHAVLSSGQHAISSPDIKGFFIVADTRQEAFDSALEMLLIIREREGAHSQNIAAIEFEAA